MSTEVLGLWEEAKKEISAVIEKDLFSIWVERLQFADFDVSANKVILSAPSSFVKNICEQWKNIFADSIGYVLGSNVTVEIIAVPPAETPASSQPQHYENSPDHTDDDNGASSESAVKPDISSAKSRPNILMSFDSFVISHSNQFAAESAKAIAERPGIEYNPYFIWGDNGLGKTHLLHAIENYVRKAFPTKKVLYIAAEDFLNDFVHAMRFHTNERFRLKYRSLDVLLIDDVQNLQGKADTQIELFNTFNKMYEFKKQMVFSCDQPIEKVRDMEQRLVGRFSWGLTVSLQPPDLELRMAVLQNWADASRLKINSDACEYVATNVTGNVRSLQGIFNNLLFMASISKKSVVTKADAVEWLKDRISAIVNTSPVSVDRIISETAKYYNLRPADLTGESRVKDIAYARQIAMYLTRRLTTLSTTQIGLHFGKKQHGTVISNVNKIQMLLDKSDEQTRYDTDHLTRKVSGS